MTVHLNINYEVEDDDPQVEEVGMQIVGEEAHAFGAAIRDRLSETENDFRSWLI